MSRKRCQRRSIVPQPPRGLRPRLSNDQRQDLEIVHLQTLDDLAKGRGTVETLWDWAGSVFTWGRAAEIAQTGAEEMAAQHELATAICARFKNTGRVLFTGPEYQLAKQGVEIMTALAHTVDRATAVQAALWSEQRLQQVANTHARVPA